MNNPDKICPRCGRPLADHQWRSKAATGEKFLLCSEMDQSDTKIWSSTQQVENSSLDFIPMSLVSLDNITKLADKFGIPTRWAEKIVRLNTVLKEFSHNLVLKEALVFMGGMALNFGVFGDDPPRLSFDLDFNFRESETQTTPLDMEEVMEVTHRIIQELLLRLDYTPEELRYKSRFELGQYTIRYRTLSGEQDIIKLDICYSRRIPLLQKKEEQGNSVLKLKILDDIDIRFPGIEELCGEKIAAFIKRKHSRDVLDIYNITKVVERGSVDLKLLRKCALVCILYQSIDPRKLEWEKLFENIHLDTYLQNTLIDRTRITDQEFDQMILVAKNFLKSLYSDFKDEEQNYLDKFFKEAKFQPELIDSNQELHPRLSNQSEIQWVLEKLFS